ncbi:MAG: hypothetical protein ABIK15_15660 [Pseudomonadota bacterium]
MVFFKKSIAVIVAVITLIFYHTIYLNAQPLVTANNDKITQNEPEMMASPEETIPVETVERKMSKWEWILLGALAVGALAAAGAAAGGGGGGDDGTAAQQPAGNSGNVEVSW